MNGLRINRFSPKSRIGRLPNYSSRMSLISLVLLPMAYRPIIRSARDSSMTFSRLCITWGSKVPSRSWGCLWLFLPLPIWNENRESTLRKNREKDITYYSNTTVTDAILDRLVRTSVYFEPQCESMRQKRHSDNSVIEENLFDLHRH